MKLKSYLTEVVFKDGSTEFKTYRSYTTVKVVEEDETDTSVVSVSLDRQEVDLNSIQLEFEGKYETTLAYKIVDSREILVLLSDSSLFKTGDTIKITYTALNEAISDLYSVDYENGVLYLASENNEELNLEYSYYNVMLSGKKAKQLRREDLSENGYLLSLNTYRADKHYSLVYSEEIEKPEEYTTPVVSNLKLNIINTSDEESL